MHNINFIARRKVYVLSRGAFPLFSRRMGMPLSSAVIECVRCPQDSNSDHEGTDQGIAHGYPRPSGCDDSPGDEVLQCRDQKTLNEPGDCFNCSPSSFRDFTNYLADWF